MRRPFRLATSLLAPGGRLLLLLAAATVGGSAYAQEPATAAADPAAVADELRPGDVIRLRIWREPDLSGDFPVAEDGEVILPKLGPVRIIGVSQDSLKRALIADYATFLRNPSIEVTLLRRIQVAGAVHKPGLYPVDPTLTVADAVALAGGATGSGRTDAVELRRGDQKVRIDLKRDTRLGDTPIRSGDQLFVPERSWLSRNTGLVFGTLTFVTGLIVTLAR